MRRARRAVYAAALEEGHRARLDALARRGSRRRRRVDERGVRREARPSVGLRVVDLEDQRLVAPHLGEVEPAVAGIVLQAVGLADAVRIAPLGHQQVLGHEAARVQDGERIRLDRLSDRAPHLDDREAAPEQPLRLVAHYLPHALRPRPLGVVVVRRTHWLAYQLRLALGLLARAQGA